MSVQDFRNYFINTSICLPGPGKKDKDQVGWWYVFLSRR